MTLIPFDRLLCAVSPYIYQSYVQRSTMKKTVLYIWLFSIAWPFSVYFTSVHVHVNVIKYYSYAAQGLFLAVSLTAYSLILRSQTTRRQNIQSHLANSADTKRTFYVAFSVTVSFVVFYLVPNYIPHANNVLFETICIAVTYCGLAVDPVLYILLHSVLRPIAYNLFTCRSLRAAGSLRLSNITLASTNGNFLLRKNISIKNDFRVISPLEIDVNDRPEGNLLERTRRVVYKETTV